ncbi:SH3 domain-containing protein [Microbacteriaceae bacterium 4G12]
MKNVLASIAAVSVVGAAVTQVAHAETDQSAQAKAQLSAQAAAQSYTVNADALRVRTGPSTSYGVIGHVSQGQSLQVVGEEQGWYKIQYNGQTAYVSKDFVTTNSSQATVQTSGQYTVNVSSLRVRTGPSTSHTIIGAVTKGQAVQVTGEVQDWYKISYGGQTAYVSKDYVSKGGSTSQPSEDTSNVASVQQDGTYVVNASSLRVRTGAGTYYPVIGGVLEGKTLQVVGVANGWYKVNHNGGTGYVSADYVKFVKGGTMQDATATSGNYYVNVSGLNVRSGAGTQYGAIGLLSYGKKVQVSAEVSGWYKINYNGSTGYISKDYVTTQLVAGAQDPAPSNPNSGDMTALISYSKTLLGVPYVWGGVKPSGFDCSGFIYHVYNKFGYSMGRTNVEGYWNSLTRTSNPQPGDIIYFKDTYRQGPSHIGIYLGGGTFIQAGDNGVAVASLNNSYWKNHFLGYSKPY